MTEAMYFRHTKDGIRCLLCPHHCLVLDENTGLCGVRRARGSTLYAESYGRITSMALDPIEKKPLRRFAPGSQILSVGSYGCNMDCPFCQNYEISMQQAPWKDIPPFTLATSSRSLASEGNIGVAYTYNEPLVGYEYVRDCAHLIRAQGQRNVLITNGFLCDDPFRELLPLMDAVNMDLKSYRKDRYQALGGDLDVIKRNLQSAANSCHLEVTTLVVPEANDTDEEMEELARFVASIRRDIPLHISRFFPRYKQSNIQPTPISRMQRLLAVARTHLDYVYAGNMPDDGEPQ